MANFNIDYLVIAGGGGGGGCSNGGFLSGAGGGAGGMRTSFGTGNVNGGLTPVESTLILTPAVSYSITVGIGGAGMINSTTQTAYGYQGVKGSDSAFDTITSTGGGGGGTMGPSPYQDVSSKGGTGGSGGGSGFRNGPTGTGSAAIPYNASPVQGFIGGGNLNYTPGYATGGGGGAGGIGGTGGPTPNNGPGGLGLENAITGTNSFYAGGGGGSTYRNSYAAPGSGGSGIGGDGGGALNSAGVGGNGTANTGSGGGGGNAGTGSIAKAGGSGGSGVVILRYTTSDIDSYTATGLTPVETIVGTDTVLSFTTVGAGTITFTAPPPPPPTTPFDGTKVTAPVTGFDKTNTTQGLKLPSGTNSNQPAGVSAIQGMIRNDIEETVDSSASAMTHYNGTNWQYFAATESPDVVYPTSLKMYLDASNAASYPGTGSTWFDLTTNQNNGTISNTSWNLNGYFDFNGSNSKVDLGTSFANNVSKTTYAAWVNFDNLNTQNFIIFPDSGTTGHGFGFFDFGNGNIYFQSDNTTNSNRGSVSNSGLYTTGQWVHMTQVYDGSATGNANRLKAYVNGNLLSLTFSGTIPSTTQATTYNTLVGTRVQGNLSLDGQISKVQIYDEALTQAEITALYNEGR